MRSSAQLSLSSPAQCTALLLCTSGHGSSQGMTDGRGSRSEAKQGPGTQKPLLPASFSDVRGRAVLRQNPVTSGRTQNKGYRSHSVSAAFSTPLMLSNVFLRLKHFSLIKWVRVLSERSCSRSSVHLF